MGQVQAGREIRSLFKKTNKITKNHKCGGVSTSSGKKRVQRGGKSASDQIRTLLTVLE